VEYLAATAAYNYDTSNDSDGQEVIETSDRSTLIGTGIPSGVVVVISPSGISALIGVGGAIVTPEVSDTGSVIPVYWREVR
jgi:type IV pilus assembly protein PilY1